MSRSARPLLIALAALLLGVGLYPFGAAAAQAAATDVRISGADRYATSAALSAREWPNGADTVFIATGADFADALAAGPAAASQNAPILLTTPGAMPQSTADELFRLKPSRIFFVGGTPSINHSVVEQAIAIAWKPGFSAERISGATRVDTAIALAQRFLPDSSEVFLVNGWSYPDALTAASAGAKHGVPVILTSGIQLTAPAQSYLQQRKPAWTTILGSNRSVDDRIYRLTQRATGQNVQRIQGVDRYETNAKVVAKYFDGSGDGIALASGENWPDALVSTPLGKRGIPVLLSADSCTTQPTRDQMSRLVFQPGELIRLVGDRLQHSTWLRNCATAAAPVRDCSINAALTAPDALNVSARFTEASTGLPLLERRRDELTPSASTMKAVTAITAFAVLGPDYRIPTYLHHGTRAGSVVITGMGDPTLKSGSTSLYWDATSVEPLRNYAWSVGAQVVSYDSWRFASPWNPAWGSQWESPRYGSITPVEAFMMDGGRDDPNDLYSPRATQPALDAGQHFAAMVGKPLDVSIRADTSRPAIATVWSPPVRTLVSQMLHDSDNMIAESLARLVALEQGLGSGYQSVQPGAYAALENLGIDPSGLQASDGSGLSGSSKVTQTFMDRALEIIGDGVAPFGELRGMMPSNGVKGTLAWRLTSIPNGAVQAKTGNIWSVYGLAGFMRLRDGQDMRFSAYVWTSSGSVGSSQRAALDRIVTAAYNCGMRLSDW